MKIRHYIVTVWLVCLTLGLAPMAFTGCKSGPQLVAYKTAATTAVTAEAAVRAYNAWAAQGKTTVAQNQAVKAAFLKYQATFAVVCDLGAAYAASGSNTNAPGAAALQQAIANSAASIADVVNLVRSFGVKL